MVLLDAARQLDGLRRRQAAVDLDTQVDVVAHRLAELAHRVDGFADLGDVGLEVRLAARLVGKWREVADGGKAARLRLDAALDQRLDRLGEDVVVDPRLVARLAAEQLVHRHAEVLAGDVPQGDVDGAQRAHDGRATKVRRAVQVLPVVLDAQWVLADQVVRPLGDDLLGGLEVAPGAGLAQAR